MWFKRNVTGRELTPREQLFVRSLAGALDSLKPKQISADDSILVCEGEPVLIAIVPHMHLAGLSIINTLTPSEIVVSFAQIGGLEYHDDLDMGFVVGRIAARTPVESWLEEAADCFREQLGRPIRLVITRTRTRVRVQYDLVMKDGKRRRIGTAGWLPWAMLGKKRTEYHDIRFTDALPPPVAYPPEVGSWLAWRTTVS